jgi:hypothetical protein
LRHHKRKRLTDPLNSMQAFQDEHIVTARQARLSLLAGLVCLARFCGASSGSCSGSCSGYDPVRGFYFAFTFQHLLVVPYSEPVESHSFSFSGFLEGMEGAPLAFYTDTHAVYEGRSIYLAVPYIPGKGLWLCEKPYPGIYLPGNGPWGQLLCDY